MEYDQGTLQYLYEIVKEQIVETQKKKANNSNKDMG